MNKKVFALTILLGITLFILAACRLMTGGLTTPKPTAETTATVHASAMDGKALLEDRCSVCHSLNYIYNSRGTPEQWKEVVSMMKANGAVLSPQEEKILDDYLGKNYSQ